jgi:hypothetical protein
MLLWLKSVIQIIYKNLSFIKWFESNQEDANFWRKYISR